MTLDRDTPGITPKQLAFLLLDVKEALYGGAAGGGKSEALLAAALQDVDDYPVSALLLRRSYRDLDKPGGLMFRAREWLTRTDAHWDGINYRWTFPSGATLNFGFIDHAGDELKFQSSEYQFVGFDELTHFPEDQYLYMFSRMRRLEGFPVKLRMRAGTNPGGPGHEWVRSRWNLPEGTNPDTGRVFISASLRDNPFLRQDEYAEGLAELGLTLQAQLLDGDWTATSTGGYFHTDRFKHVGWDELPDARDIVCIIRYWDLAATEKTEENMDPDWTVGLKLAIRVNPTDRNLDYYILDVERFRGSPGTVEARIEATALKDGPRVAQWVEQERGAAGKLLFRSYANTILKNSPSRPLYVTGDKETNAKVAAARVDDRRVFLLPGEWVPEFMAECGIFPFGGHDDQVDAFAKAIEASNRERLMSTSNETQKRSGDMRANARARAARRRQKQSGSRSRSRDSKGRLIRSGY